MQATADNLFKALAGRTLLDIFGRRSPWQRNESQTPRALQRITERKGATMRIKLTSVFVDDQDKALKFYTEVLGFTKKHEFKAGQYTWLTVVSAEDPEGTQLVLELNSNPAAKTYQQEIFRQGVAAANFFVDDVQKEHDRIKQHGVKFTKDPTKTTGSTIAILDDTCGNLIQITHLDW
jgi:predicted enzyme related to lactoylglutathione lyase